MIFLIIGKANAGKTTTAWKMAADSIRQGNSVIVLDADDVRSVIEAGFSDTERLEHLKRIAAFASIIEKQVDLVIVSAIAPLRKYREEMIKYFNEFQLIYVTGGYMWDGTIFEEPITLNIIEGRNVSKTNSSTDN